ncbi:MAG: M28 family peptidase [Saprospiraceae bacterium]|nr:M28 family peptidase [Saprospiraceae bacterium]MCB9322857.1 M28 family peptidase [Lewinellaceae bacterium]
MALSSQPSDSLSIDYMKKVVGFLASDEMQGRATGSEQEVLAADFIAQEFHKIPHCQVRHQYFRIELDSLRLKSQNVIGFVNNHAKKTIVISAHYDHLGLGGSRSLSKKTDEVHNGADDNASGVALMLDMARILAQKKARYNFLFVAYSGHEIGLFGSKYFAGHLKKKYKPIAFTMNFDMVGRLDNSGALYYDCSPDLLTSFSGAQAEKVRLVKSTFDRVGILDTKWFLERNISVVTFTTGRHIDYHKTTDDIEYLNFEGLLSVEKVMLNWLNSFQ